jgi:hypothetical protein
MQKGQYIVIKVEDIEGDVKELKSIQDGYEKYSKEWFKCQYKIETIKYILSNPKDLYDIVENAYQEGALNNAIVYSGKFKQDYLKNLEI